MNKKAIFIKKRIEDFFLKLKIRLNAIDSVETENITN